MRLAGADASGPPRRQRVLDAIPPASGHRGDGFWSSSAWTSTQSASLWRRLRGTDPVVTTTATGVKLLAIAAKHPTQPYIAGTLSVLALGALAVSYAAIAQLVTRRGWVIATVAALLGGIGAFCGAIINGWPVSTSPRDRPHPGRRGRPVPRDLLRLRGRPALHLPLPRQRVRRAGRQGGTRYGAAPCRAGWRCCSPPGRNSPRQWDPSGPRSCCSCCRSQPR